MTHSSRARAGGGAARALSVLLLSALVISWFGAAPRAHAAPPASSFEWGPCPDAVPPEQAARVRCGVLTVPESRASGSGRTIRLPVAKVPSRSATPRPDPVVLPTAGGPGAGSLSALWYFLDYADWATAERDVIVVEQRGDKLADPTLNCPETEVAARTVDGRLLSGGAGRAAIERGVRACHDRLAAAGVDLGAYTSAQSALDLADLRRALGYDQWNLYGLSYGSTVALVTMRDQPDGLRSVVLDGVSPPNGQQYRNAAGFSASVRSLAAACAADAACHARYPDLEGSLARLLDRVRAHPIPVTVRAPGGAPVGLEIGEADVLDGLFDALYDDHTTRALPFILDQLARGNDAVALPLAQQNLERADWFTEGLQKSIRCSEELPFYPGAEQPAAGDALAARGSPLTRPSRARPGRCPRCRRPPTTSSAATSPR